MNSELPDCYRVSFSLAAEKYDNFGAFMTLIRKVKGGNEKRVERSMLGTSTGPAPLTSHAHVSTRNEHHDDTATLKSVIIAVKSNGKRKIADWTE